MTLGNTSKFRLFAGADAEEGAAAEPAAEPPAEEAEAPLRQSKSLPPRIQHQSLLQNLLQSLLQRNLPQRSQSQKKQPCGGCRTISRTSGFQP